jgi:CHASE3 domain sensor protein
MRSTAATRPGPGRPKIRDALRLALIGFAIFVLVFALNAMMYVAAHRLDPARDELNRTWDVLVTISATLIGLADAESMQRAYMLTGDRAYLAGYARDRAATVGSLGRLRRLTADNPYQQELADRLRRVLEDKFAFMDALSLERGKGAAAHYDLARGHRLLVLAREILAAMTNEEARLLRIRDDWLSQWIRLIQYGILAVLVQQVTLFVTGLAAFLKTYRSVA